METEKLEKIVVTNKTTEVLPGQCAIGTGKLVAEHFSACVGIMAQNDFNDIIGLVYIVGEDYRKLSYAEQIIDFIQDYRRAGAHILSVSLIGGRYIMNLNVGQTIVGVQFEHISKTSEILIRLGVAYNEVTSDCDGKPLDAFKVKAVEFSKGRIIVTQKYDDTCDSEGRLMQPYQNVKPDIMDIDYLSSRLPKSCGSSERNS